MSENNILVSVIIPTKNRHLQLMDTLIAHNFWPLDLREKIEVVISDNSLNSLNQEDLLQIRTLFPKTIYHHTNEDLTISDNFNQGFNLSSGNWIVFIGDDDFFMPSIIDAIQKHKVENVDAIIYNPHKYYWDSCKFTNSNVYGAPSTIVLSKPWLEEKINPKTEFIKSIKNGGLTIEKMPRAYHGLIRRDVFTKYCMHPDGQFYLGSPDISMATMLTLRSIKVQSVSKSLTVYGASDGSGGGMTTSKSHVQALDKTLFLSKKFRNSWNETIPKYWSEYTVFPASILYITELYNLTIPTKLNYASTYLTCLLNEFEHRKLVYNAFKALNSAEKVSFFIQLPRVLLRKLSGLIYRKIKSTLFKGKLIYLKPEEIIKYDI